MSKKSQKGSKSLPPAVPKKPEVIKKAVQAKGTNVVNSEAEAKALVEKSYKNPMHVDYCVLSNGHVFYGMNRGAALAHARIYGYEVFDVKLS